MRGLVAMAGAGACSLVLTACNGNGSPTEVSPTPSQPDRTAEPTLANTPGLQADLDGFRPFAVHVEQAVVDRDADWIADTATTSSKVCGEPSFVEPLCEGLPDATVVRGVLTGLWRGEGGLAAPEDFRSSTRDYLNSLAEPTLYAIAALDRNVGGSIGGPAVFAIVASADEPENTVRVFEFVEHGGAWSMPLVIHVTDPSGEEWLSGDCGDCYDRWERWEGGA